MAVRGPGRNAGPTVGWEVTFPIEQHGVPDEYQDGSIPVTHYNLYDEWFASVSGVKAHATNMKGIQRHGSKFRVQKRVDGQLRKWTFDTLEQAVRKRDAIFTKVDAK